jgi:hypothetical protein
MEIAALLPIADSRCDATKSEQIEAANKLLSEFRLQISEFQRSSPLWFWQLEPYFRFRTEIDPLLDQWIANLGRQTCADPNPLIALARFLGKRKKPGKRAKNTDRDFSITLAVVTKMESGVTLEEATALIAADYKLEADTVRKIYLRRYKEVRAARHQI